MVLASPYLDSDQNILGSAACKKKSYRNLDHWRYIVVSIIHIYKTSL